jgi:hypothetical protein
MSSDPVPDARAVVEMSSVSVLEWEVFLPRQSAICFCCDYLLLKGLRELRN